MKKIKRCHHNYNELSKGGKFLICRCGKKIPVVNLISENELLNPGDYILPGPNDL